MGKRGPKPKPTALKVFEGNRVRANRLGEVVPPGGPEPPAPPDWLGPQGKAAWNEIAPVLFPIGCLTKSDYRLLCTYCEAWDDFFAARAVIEVEGMIATTDKGTCYQHPAVGIKNKAIQRIRQIGGDFGLSPSARVGLNLAPQAKQNSLAAFKAQ
jgi:P27 family predicted phage terminase small subunit